VTHGEDYLLDEDTGPPGALVGGIVGGVVGGIGGALWGATNSDFYQREVNFHLNGWDAVDLAGSL